ncbi:unnamed protein product, partial [Pleuronectes platessa]
PVVNHLPVLSHLSPPAYPALTVTSREHIILIVVSVYRRRMLPALSEKTVDTQQIPDSTLGSTEANRDTGKAGVTTPECLYTEDGKHPTRTPLNGRIDATPKRQRTQRRPRGSGEPERESGLTKGKECPSKFLTAVARRLRGARPRASGTRSGGSEKRAAVGPLDRVPRLEGRTGRSARTAVCTRSGGGAVGRSHNRVRGARWTGPEAVRSQAGSSQGRQPQKHRTGSGQVRSGSKPRPPWAEPGAAAEPWDSEYAPL